MKKFFLFAVAIATLSLVSCNGGNDSSASDGNSQATSVDPNSGVPQTEASTSVSTVSDANATPVENAVSDAVDDVQKKAEGVVDDAKKKAEGIVDDAKKKADDALKAGQKKVDDAIKDGQKKVDDAIKDGQKQLDNAVKNL